MASSNLGWFVFQDMVVENKMKTEISDVFGVFEEGAAIDEYMHQVSEEISTTGSRKKYTLSASFSNLKAFQQLRKLKQTICTCGEAEAVLSCP